MTTIVLKYHISYFLFIFRIERLAICITPLAVKSREAFNLYFKANCSITLGVKFSTTDFIAYNWFFNRFLIIVHLLIKRRKLGIKHFDALSYLQTKAKIPNIVGPTTLGVINASVCTYKLTFDRFQTLHNKSQQHETICNRVYRWTQHATYNDVGSCWPTISRPFARGFTVTDQTTHDLQLNLYVRPPLVSDHLP